MRKKISILLIGACMAVFSGALLVSFQVEAQEWPPNLFRIRMVYNGPFEPVTFIEECVPTTADCWDEVIITN